MNLDFTYKKYVEIVKAISKSQYKVITIKEYIQQLKLPEKFIIIRHDVDLDPFHQVQFAKKEHDFGIKTSYYFRHVEKIYKENIIDEVHSLGHEVGYHYEVFTKAKGDPEKAIEIFRDELADFQKNWDSKTVCPHGGSFVDNTDGYSLKNMIKLIPKIFSGKTVFSKHVNFNLWDDNSFEDFGIIGDAYRSVDFSDILYLSDTGRSWDNKYKRLDKVNSRVNPKFNIRKSDNIIDVIKKGSVDSIYLLVHFEQWKNNFMDWVSWYAAQLVRRNGKKIIFKMKQN